MCEKKTNDSSFNNWLLLCFQFEIAVLTRFSQGEIQRLAK